MFAWLTACETELTSVSFYNEEDVSITEFIKEKQDTFARFMSIMEVAELVGTLSAWNPHGLNYTLFLPTNEAFDRFIYQNRDHWLVREILLYSKRTLKRLDVSARSTFALVEPGSCFVGFLADVLFSVDRSYMLEGQFEEDTRPAPGIRLTSSNFGPLPMSNNLSRLETRFLGEPQSYEQARSLIGQSLDARAAMAAGLITFALDDLDWEDEIRLLLEERASFSPDALSGMESNLRFAGPETMETKIFGRLSAWQNWIFQRPNAVGECGALKRYGTGQRPVYDKKRI